jgi:PAS domain S-box-containing protein
VEDDRPTPTPLLATSPSDAPASGRAAVLIVDDHPANLVALEAILAPLGHDLVKATSGEEALKQILRRDFALILLDVQMAGMSGYETAGLVKQHRRSRHIPIIFITAVNRDAAHAFQGYSQGAADYLVKPFDADILRSKARVFIDLFLKEQKIKAQERLLRRRDREALERRSEARYQRLIDALPQCMWAASTEGQLHYWNRAALDYFGLQAAKATDGAFWAAIHPEDREAARAHWDRALRAETPFERQLRLERADDASARWHLVKAVPERDEEGTVVGWIATATDMHDQKTAEEALRRAVAHRDDFLSVASHELRTPLTSLKLELANLARLAQRPERVSGERIVAKVNKIDGQAERLHRLISDLLDVSCITSGRLELHLEDVDLTQVANEVGQRFREEAERAGCALVLRDEGALVGRWDRNRLEQVVTNLISNALKYGACKPIEIATAAGENGHARLIVRDHGLGIAPRDQDRIFGRFERAAPSRHFGGIGLGLWIVKQIVDALGGTIAVESQLGAGSVFTVELPCTPAEDHLPPRAADAARARQARN